MFVISSIPYIEHYSTINITKNFFFFVPNFTTAIYANYSSHFLFQPVNIFNFSDHHDHILRLKLIIR